MRISLILPVILGLLSLSSPAMAGEDEVLLTGIGSHNGTGNSNEASVLQAGIANEARSKQIDGNRNAAVSVQTGWGNATLIEQSGGTNGASVTQLGKGNLAISDQKGLYNDTTLTQTGHDLVIVSQKGVGLTLTPDQIPDYPALVIQHGVGSRAVTKVIPLSKR